VSEPDRSYVSVALPATRPAGPGGPDAAPSEPSAVDGVALVTIDRPEALNALSAAVIAGIAEACARLDAEPACRAIVFTGAGTRAFAAGADVAEMAGETAEGIAASARFDAWDAIANVRKPTVAAVRGYALGGGLELAMACDMLVLGDDAKVGQPEIRLGILPGAGGTQRQPKIRLGILPGAGGTQRLTRAIGKPRAMELILTGRVIGAAEADRLGLATRVVPAGETVAAALDLAASIAAMPPLAVRTAKEAVRMADEMPLSAGLRYERRLFQVLFGTEDKTEGMTAFLEKRPPEWRGR
jgi:enoyl-CoA hydratase